MTLNIPVIRLLVAKDWQLFQKQLALYVLAGIVALCFLGLAKPWAFYVGALMLIIVMVSIACFSISTSLMNERKEKTLAFVMSLPVSPLDFTVAKLVGNVCNDPAVSAQVRPLKHMPRRVSSCPAPGVGAGSCRTGSSPRSRASRVVGFRTGAGGRTALSMSG